MIESLSDDLLLGVKEALEKNENARNIQDILINFVYTNFIKPLKVVGLMFVVIIILMVGLLFCNTYMSWCMYKKFKDFLPPF